MLHPEEPGHGVPLIAFLSQFSYIIHYDVMGIKVSTKWRKYIETCMFLRLHVKKA